MRSLLTPNNGCSGSVPEGFDRRSCEVFLAEPIVPSALDSRAKTPLGKRESRERRGLTHNSSPHPTPPHTPTTQCRTPTDTPTAPASMPSCCCSCVECGSPELNVQRRDKSFFNNSNYKVDRQTHRQTDNRCMTKYQIYCEKSIPTDKISQDYQCVLTSVHPLTLALISSSSHFPVVDTCRRAGKAASKTGWHEQNSLTTATMSSSCNHSTAYVRQRHHMQHRPQSGRKQRTLN